MRKLATKSIILHKVRIKIQEKTSFLIRVADFVRTKSRRNHVSKSKPRE